MTNQPNTRQATKTGDICEYITSGSRDWKSYYSDEGAVFIRTQDINKDRLDLSAVARVALPEKVEGKRSRVEPGDLLVTITGANVGKVAVVPEGVPEAYVSQSVGLMRLKDKRWAPYLHYFLQSEQTGRKQLLNLVYGIGRPVLSLQNLRDIPVSLPPLDDQRSIVAEIEKQFTRLDAGVVALCRVQANLKRYRAAVLKAACEGRLVPTEAELAKKQKSIFETGEALLARILTERRKNWHGRGKYNEPATPDIVEQGPLPDGWTWANGEQLFLWSSGEGLTQKDIQQGRYPVYGGNGVTGYHNAFVAEIPTLVIGRVGALCGNIYMTDGPAWITDNAIYAIQTPSCVEMKFARLAFTRAELNKRAAGSGQPFVNQRMLNETMIALPPLREQTRIVAEVERRLSVIDELETVVTANLQRATRLRQSILQQAFSGRFRS